MENKTELQEFIDKKDVYLYVDVMCSACGKRMAMSNAYQYDHKYWCEKHYSPLIKESQMENKSCENCLNREDCGTNGSKESLKCDENKSNWKLHKSIPTPDKMIELTIGGITSHIDPSSQPAIQSYLAQEIEMQDLISRKDAVQHVELNPLFLDTLEMLLVKHKINKKIIQEVRNFLDELNPLNLKQQE